MMSPPPFRCSSIAGLHDHAIRRSTDAERTSVLGATEEIQAAEEQAPGQCPRFPRPLTPEVTLTHARTRSATSTRRSAKGRGEAGITQVIQGTSYFAFLIILLNTNPTYPSCLPFDLAPSPQTSRLRPPWVPSTSTSGSPTDGQFSSPTQTTSRP